jgi:hypothetical protein
MKMYLDKFVTGKFLNRQKMPKNDVGDTYSWKDLNLGKDIVLYGRVFGIYDCDGFTKVLRVFLICFFNDANNSLMVITIHLFVEEKLFDIDKIFIPIRSMNQYEFHASFAV